MSEAAAGPSPSPGQGQTNRGWGRLLVVVYAVFAISAIGRSSVQLLQKGGEAPLAYTLSAVAALVYLVATLSLARPGPRATRVAWVTVGIELVGVLVIGTLSVLHPEYFADDTVWSGFGSGYGYIPLVLPIAGLAWLARATRVADTRTD